MIFYVVYYQSKDQENASYSRMTEEGVFKTRESALDYIYSFAGKYVDRDNSLNVVEYEDEAHWWHKYSIRLREYIEDETIKTDGSTRYKEDDEMCEKVDFEEAKKEMKKQEIKLKIKNGIAKVKEAARATINWCKGHPEVTGVIMVVATKAVRDIHKDARNRREIRFRELRTYDPHTGDWYELRRVLTNKEKEEIRHRMDYGERKVDILRSMRVLK